MFLPTDIDLVPGAACTSVLLLFLSSLSMSEAVVDIGVADFEPVKSDNSSCRKKRFYIDWEIHDEGRPNSNNCNIEGVIFEELMIKSNTAHSSTEEWGERPSYDSHKPVVGVTYVW